MTHFLFSLEKLLGRKKLCARIRTVYQLLKKYIITLDLGKDLRYRFPNKWSKISKSRLAKTGSLFKFYEVWYNERDPNRIREKEREWERDRKKEGKRKKKSASN